MSVIRRGKGIIFFVYILRVIKWLVNGIREVIVYEVIKDVS